jgi:hypothetical protein
MAFFGPVMALVVCVATSSCSTCSPRSAVAAAQADTIFRYVTIGPNVPVVLGAPLPPAARPHLQEAAPNVYAVRPGHFSGAAGIAFHLASDGRVAAAVFTYAPGGESFEAKVASYAEALGPSIRAGGTGERAAHWQDARTRFEVAERAGGLRAVLMNLASAAELRAAADVRPGT